MKKIFALLIVLLVIFASCSVPGDKETEETPETTASEVMTDGGTTSETPGSSASEATTDGGTAGETDLTETYLDGVAEPWYFGWSYPGLVRRYLNDLAVRDLSEEEKQLALQTPVVYEETVGDLGVRIDFFREYYGNGSLLQVRITLTNRGEEEVTVHDAPYSSAAIERGEDPWQDPLLDWISPEEMNADKVIDGGSLMVLHETLGSGESAVFERVFALEVPPEGEPIYFVYLLSSSREEGVPIRVELTRTVLP